MLSTIANVIVFFGAMAAAFAAGAYIFSETIDSLDSYPPKSKSKKIAIISGGIGVFCLAMLLILAATMIVIYIIALIAGGATL